MGVWRRQAKGQRGSQAGQRVAPAAYHSAPDCFWLLLTTFVNTLRLFLPRLLMAGFCLGASGARAASLEGAAAPASHEGSAGAIGARTAAANAGDVKAQ